MYDGHAVVCVDIFAAVALDIVLAGAAYHPAVCVDAVIVLRYAEVLALVALLAHEISALIVAVDGACRDGTALRPRYRQKKSRCVVLIAFLPCILLPSNASLLPHHLQF